MYSLLKIAEITRARIQGNPDGAHIRGFSTDSRSIFDTAGILFFALQGEHFNANSFIAEAYGKGIRYFVCTPAGVLPDAPDAVFLTVEKPGAALQQLAAFHRSRFTYPVIGITGSNGKTIVKEWLSELLHDAYKIVKNPGSFNSQVGVPLSVLLMNEQHTLGIFEAGISKPGEMQKLEAILKPDIGVFTQLGDAHSEGFSDAEEKLKEKFLLFRNTQVVILNAKYRTFLPAGIASLTWSREKKEADVFIKNIRYDEGYTVVSWVYKNKTHESLIPFSDDASVENVITCLCVACYLQLPLDTISGTVRNLHPVQMRLSLQKGNNNNILINDAYNADLNALKNALEFMHRQSGSLEKTLVLSDILQSGKEAGTLYAEVNALLEKYGIKHCYGIGSSISACAAQFTVPFTGFASTAGFLQNNPLRYKSNALILLKGARVFEFEKIARQLSAQHHTTRLEIQLNAVAHNFHTYRNLLPPGTRMMVMVKAFSYGSGSNEIASLLQYHKADYLAVAYADEGVHLRRNGITIPIMVMNTEARSFDLLHEFNLEPAVYSMHQLRALSGFSGRELPVHLEIETGMHRLGFEPEEIPAMIRFLEQNTALKPRSIFSHLASAEDVNDDAFTRQQIATFREASGAIKKAFPDVWMHLLNSPGIARWSKEAAFDMVRLGIGLYGIDPTQTISEKLLPASQLISSISQIKHLKPGDGVSYNRRFVADKNMHIATIPIGYADGLNRKLGYGNGAFIIQGKKAPILGTICMDMTMVDITGIECREGDEVIIFGEGARVTDMAAQAGTISYEILSTLSQRVTRVYVQE